MCKELCRGAKDIADCEQQQFVEIVFVVHDQTVESNNVSTLHILIGRLCAEGSSQLGSSLGSWFLALAYSS